MEDEPRRNRIDRATDRFVALGRSLSGRGRELLHHPVRVLIGGICIVLLAVALPLLIGGGTRLNSAWIDWRHDRAVGRDWVSSTATIMQVRDRDGLELRLTYRDRAGGRHQASVLVEASGSQWVNSRLPIHYDPHHPSRVDLVDVAVARPLGNALVAGASVGAGLAALILALGILAPAARARSVGASVPSPARPARVVGRGARARDRGLGGRDGQPAGLDRRRGSARPSVLDRLRGHARRDGAARRRSRSAAC